MKIYRLQFSYFDSVEWKTVHKKILAKSILSLMRCFLEETEYINEDKTPKNVDYFTYKKLASAMSYEQSKKEQRKLLWLEIRDDIEIILLPYVITTK